MKILLLLKDFYKQQLIPLYNAFWRTSARLHKTINNLLKEIFADAPNFQTQA